MGRLTQNPKVIAGGIALSLGVAAYLHGPEFLRQIMAPPPKPAVPPAPAVEELKFYRMVPKVLPERWQDLLQAPAPKATMFDEVPRDEKAAQEDVLPELPPGWHLSSIYFSSNERVAVVSGRILQEGDWMEPFKVKTILADRVIFQHPLGEREMTIGQKISTGSGSPAPSGGGPSKLPGGAGGDGSDGKDSAVLLKALEGLDKWRDSTKGAP